MNDKTLGAYQRTTPDPDETTGEALARLQAEMTRLLDEADAELRDEADGGVTAALIEKEVEQHDAAESRPLTPDVITDEMRERARAAFFNEWNKVDSNTSNAVNAALTAALTEPPARPEGAEEIEALLAGSWPIDREGLSAAADDLAMNGVRVVSEDGAR